MTKSSMSSQRIPGLLMVAALLIIACRPTKNAIREIDYLKKPENVIENVRDSGLQYSALQLKASISILSDKQKTSFKSTMRMTRDSAIWTSITFLGIAGAKAIITNDSVKLINYKDRDYVSTDFGKIVDLFNSNLINLKNLQAILLGQLVDVEDYQKLHMEIVEGQYVISTLSDRKASRDWIEKKLEKMEKKLEKQEDKEAEKGKERIERKYERRPDKFDGLEIEVWIDPSTSKINKLIVRDYLLNGTVTAWYSDFNDTKQGKAPYRTRLEIRAKKNIDVDIVYSKISVEDKVEMPFSIPTKYERRKL